MEKLTVIDNRFGGQKALIAEVGFYREGMQPCIKLYCEDGEPHSTATVCLAVAPPKNCIWIKDWQENAGMSRMLFNAGLIHPDIKGVQGSGFVVVSAYQMTDKLQAAFDKHTSQMKAA